MQRCSVSVYDAIFGDIDPGYVVRAARLVPAPRREFAVLSTNTTTVTAGSWYWSQLNAIMMTVNTMWLVLTAVLCAYP